MGQTDKTDDKQRQIDTLSLELKELSSRVDDLHHELFDKEFITSLAGLVRTLRVIIKVVSALVGAGLSVAAAMIVNWLTKMG